MNQVNNKTKYFISIFIANIADELFSKAVWSSSVTSATEAVKLQFSLFNLQFKNTIKQNVFTMQLLKL